MPALPAASAQTTDITNATRNDSEICMVPTLTRGTLISADEGTVTL
jgi:hypothetical protein